MVLKCPQNVSATVKGFHIDEDLLKYEASSDDHTNINCVLSSRFLITMQNIAEGHCSRDTSGSHTDHRKIP